MPLWVNFGDKYHALVRITVAKYELVRRDFTPECSKYVQYRGFPVSGFRFQESSFCST